MPATAAAYNAALKQGWTSDQLESQIYEGNPFMDSLEKTDEYTVGLKATVPLKTARAGGYTAYPASGSTGLNLAGAVGIQAVDYDLTFHAQPIKVEHATIVKTRGKPQAVANVIDTEVENATGEIRKQLVRQAMTNGDALIAQCGTTSGSATVVLSGTTGAPPGADALKRRWLHKGLVVDIGTTSNEVLRVADAVISSVDPVNNTITIGSSVTTAATDFVSVANARSGATSFEMNGLQQLIATSGSFGSLSTATEPEWAAASVDSTTTTLSLPAILALREATLQGVGEPADTVLTSFHQQTAFYNLLQMQVRYPGDTGLGAGNVDGVQWSGMTIKAQVDVPNRFWWHLNMKDLLVVKDTNAPYWHSDIDGTDGPLVWVQNTSAFMGTLFYPINMCARRRNSHAGFTALT